MKVFNYKYLICYNSQPASPDQVYSMSCRPCGTLCCYADDSSFSNSSSSLDTINGQISNNYNTIAAFMNDKKLKLNSDKTHLMLLGNDSAWRNKLSPNSLSLNTGQELIRTTSCENLLGVLVSKI